MRMMDLGSISEAADSSLPTLPFLRAALGLCWYSLASRRTYICLCIYLEKWKTKAWINHMTWLNMYLWWGGFPSLTSSATLCEKERWLIHRYVHEKGLVGILWKKSHCARPRRLRRHQGGALPRVKRLDTFKSKMNKRGLETWFNG